MPEPLTSPCQSATRRWGSTEACPAPLPRPSSGPTPGASSTASPGPNSHPCEVVVQGPWGKRADAEALPETRHAHAHTRAHTFKRHSSHAHVLSNVHACMHQHRALTDLCVFMGSSAGIHMDKLTCVYCQNALVQNEYTVHVFPHQGTICAHTCMHPPPFYTLASTGNPDAVHPHIDVQGLALQGRVQRQSSHMCT